LPFDEALGLVVAFAVLLPAGLALAGSFVLDVDDGQPQELDGGLVGREVAAGQPWSLSPPRRPPARDPEKWRSEKWRVVCSTIDDWSRATRLCVIYLTVNVPVDVLL
jgi:hypothetical protein